MKIRKVSKSRIVIGCVLLVSLWCYYLNPYKLEFLGHYHKIWAHRANSIEKLHSALNYYKGVELDLIYNSQENFFDINHPPAKSIDLRFETYINSLEKQPYPSLWLDIKNLKEDNAQLILDKLLRLFREKKYPLDRILIETRYPKALPIFMQAGFKTSYYLPFYMAKKDSISLQKDIKRIKSVLKEQPSIGISTSHKDYSIIKEYFPNQKKYIWILVPFVNIDFLTTREILNDETVEVVLMNYTTLRGNR